MRSVNQQLASPLGRAVGRSPMDEEHLRSAATAAYRKTGVAAVTPDMIEQIDNEIVRRAVVQIIEKRYGKRESQ
jgi:hypothetical protein